MTIKGIRGSTRENISYKAVLSGKVKMTGMERGYSFEREKRWREENKSFEDQWEKTWRIRKWGLTLEIFSQIVIQATKKRCKGERNPIPGLPLWKLPD